MTSDLFIQVVLDDEGKHLIVMWDGIILAEADRIVATDAYNNKTFHYKLLWINYDNFKQSNLCAGGKYNSLGELIDALSYAYEAQFNKVSVKGFPLTSSANFKK